MAVEVEVKVVDVEAEDVVEEKEAVIKDHWLINQAGC